MPTPREIDLYAEAAEVLGRFSHGGVLCTVVDSAGNDNVITLGWGQLGPSYHRRPVLTIAITPLRYSWRFLEEVPEFVIAVPDDATQEAAAYCGKASGRDGDKFAAAGLTRVPAQQVRPPAIAECPINIECRVYTRVDPPHMLLTPGHRQRPVEDQHTIYFAEVLAAYRWA
jgi:flavin reductase (DIM6/NTAB) family NADH-FMN oxidoreductase RutF